MSYATTPPPKVALNAGGLAPIYAARAWCNFQVLAGTPIINAHGNVSHLTDRGVGQFTVHFDVELQDTGFAVLASADRPGFGLGCVAGEDATAARAVGSVPIVTANDGGAHVDPSSVSVAVFR